MTQRVVLILSFILLLLGHACTNRTQPQSYQETQTVSTPFISTAIPKTPLSAAIFTQTTTPTPMPTRLPTEVISTPTASIIQFAQAGLERQCIPVEERFLRNDEFAGTLLIYSGRYQYFNLLNHQMNYLINESETGAYKIYGVDDTSPDRSKISALSSTNNEYEIVILNASGKIINRFADQDPWKMITWLDNDYLLILLRQPGDSFLIYDPLQAEPMKTFTIDAPNAYFADSPRGQPWLVSEIDPTATRAIYFDHQDGGRAILWDIKKHQILAWLPFPVPADSSEDSYYSSDLPFGIASKDWSPDGSQFVLSAPTNAPNTLPASGASDELFSISRDGEIRQLTHFSADFGEVHISSTRSWSPDGRYLAFWMQIIQQGESEDDVPYTLIVYDVQAQTGKDYCVQLHTLSLDTPIWSPDGKQLVIGTDSPSQQLFLDLAQEKIVETSLNGSIYGWLVNEP